MQRGNQAATGKLIADNRAALRQALELLERLDEQRFSQPNGALGLRSVGSHLRHCLDFYQCFLVGLPTGRINYDQRARNEQVENNRLCAANQIKMLIEGLSRLSPTRERHAVEVLLEGAAEPLDAAEWSNSSVKRELQFLLSHTIHHYSLIAVGLRAQGFEPGADFGVAPSTLRYWRQTA